MGNFLKKVYHILALTGVWIIPIVYIFVPRIWPDVSGEYLLYISLALSGWMLFNNVWAVMAEGKRVDELDIGAGLVPETGLKKEPAQKRIAMYPKVPGNLLSRKPEGIILGTHKGRYVRVPLKENFHTCILGGSGSGKTSTVLLDTLLANYAGGRNEFLTFAIDIKGELHEKSTSALSEDVLVVDPTDRMTSGWDAFYRLHKNPSDDLIIEAIEEIAQALILSTNPKDMFFVENARSIFTGLMAYYFKNEESFIDSVNKILEADAKKLIADIVKESSPSDLWYKYLAKFAGKDAESVEDCMVEMTTSLSVFSKSDIRYCFRDNCRKASPYSFREGKSVFLSIPEHMLESYKAILRLCTVQTLKEMERRSEQEERPVVILIDEFARLGKLEGIFNALATLRSRHVTVILAFQSMAQAEAVYSKEEARVLVDNCRVKVVCEASDPATCDMVRAWAGKYREMKETMNGGKNRHKSYSYEEKDVVSANDLVTLTKKEEVVLVISGTGYLRVKKCFYFKDKTLNALAARVREQNKEIER